MVWDITNISFKSGGWGEVGVGWSAGGLGYHKYLIQIRIHLQVPYSS